MRADKNDSDWNDRSPGGLMMPSRPQGPVVIQGGYGQLTTDLRYDAEATHFDLNLREYWAILVKRRLVIAAAVAAAVALALLVTLLMRPIYMASSTIQIDREAARVMDVDGVEPPELQSNDFLQTQYGLLQSRSLAERVVDDLGLANNAKFMEGTGGSGLAFWRRQPSERAALAQRRNRAVNILMRNLTIEPERNSRLVHIRYESPYPEVAKLVADAVADNFIAAQLDRRA
jgi:polysaccharide biosynthesis transport protein